MSICSVTCQKVRLVIGAKRVAKLGFTVKEHIYHIFYEDEGDHVVHKIILVFSNSLYLNSILSS